MFSPRHHWHCSRRFSEAEARMCFETPHPEQSQDRFTWTSKDWGQSIARFVTSMGGEVPAYIIEQVGRVPVGIAQGINDVLHRENKLDRAQEALRNLATLTTNAPPAVLEWIAGIFKEHPELSAEAMVNMLSYQHWIVAFEGLRLEEPADHPTKVAEKKATENAQGVISANTQPWGPREYLQTLSYLERRERFATLVTSVIPDDAKKNARFNTIFSDTDPSERIQTYADHQDVLVPALKKIYGLQAFDSKGGDRAESMDEKLARESISQKFFIFDKTGKKLRKGDSGTAMLHEQLQDQLRRRPGRLTVAGIREQMEKGNPPASLMLGAVNSGIVNDEDIQKAIPELNKLHTERQQASNEQRRYLEEVTRASRDELKRGAETMSQRFENAPGWMKLAIVAALVGGVMKFPKTSAAIGAIFAGQYFLLKDNNPLDSTGNTILSAMSFLRGAKVAPPLGQASAVSQLGEQVLSFLPNQAHENINTSVTGFALLAGMDVSLLATHTEADDPTGRMVTVRAWDQPLRTAIKGSLKDRGLDPAAAARFFPSEDPNPKDEDGNRTEPLDCSKNRNLCETGDAMASVFYLLGEQRVKEGRHTRKTLDMATLGLIEQARLSSTGSGYYDDISDNLRMNHPQQGRSVNIRQEYYEVMLEGIDEARSRPGQTLDQVMRKLAAKPETRVAGTSVPPKEKSLGDGMSASTASAVTGSPGEAPAGKAGDATSGRAGKGPDGKAGDGSSGATVDGPDGRTGAGVSGKTGSAPDGRTGTGPDGKAGDGTAGGIGKGPDGKIGDGTRGKVGRGVDGRSGSGPDGRTRGGTKGSLDGGPGGTAGEGTTGKTGEGPDGRSSRGPDARNGNAPRGTTEKGINGSSGSAVRGKQSSAPEGGAGSSTRGSSGTAPDARHADVPRGGTDKGIDGSSGSGAKGTQNSSPEGRAASGAKGTSGAAPDALSTGAPRGGVDKGINGSSGSGTRGTQSSGPDGRSASGSTGASGAGLDSRGNNAPRGTTEKGVEGASGSGARGRKASGPRGSNSRGASGTLDKGPSS